MPEVKMRYNPDSAEVELVVDGEVAMASGQEEFQSWVDHHNIEHPPVEPEPTEEEKLRAEVEDLKTQLEVANAANSPEPVEEETTTEE